MNRKLPSAPVRSAQAGFTLVEIMVVIVILGLLATLVVQNVGGASDQARETKAQADVKTIAGAVRWWYANKGSLPESLDVLAQKDDRGRSQLEELPLDPWNRPYELREGNTRSDWEVVSLGQDGIPSEDDISSKSAPADK